MPVATQAPVNNTSNGDDSSSSDTGDVVKNVVLIVLIGIAIILCLLLLTYVFSIIADRYCCCFPWFRPVSDQNDFDRGPVSRKAGLWGLKQSERALILQHIFQKTSFIYNSQDKKSQGNKDGTEPEKDAIHLDRDPLGGSHIEKVFSHNSDIESPPLQAAPNSEASEADLKTADQEESDRAEKTKVTATTGNDDAERTKKEPNNNNEDQVDNDAPVDDADHERICCICLAEYQDGCQIMTGMSCIHMFHYDCSMEWLQKHDQCPYCRKEMMSPIAMRNAAVAVLGDERVKEMGVSSSFLEGMGRSGVDATDDASVQAAAASSSVSRPTNDEAANLDVETGNSENAP